MLKVAQVANQDAEQAVCLDCDEPFVPKRRWGAHPGPYRRCGVCLEGRRLDRGLKLKQSKKSPAYLKILELLRSKSEDNIEGVFLGDRQIAATTGLSTATIERVIRKMKRDYTITVTMFKLKYEDGKWMNTRRIVVNYIPPKEQE